MTTSKATFSVFLLNFLAQFEKSVEIESKFDFDGLFIIGEVNSKTNVHLYTANLSSKMQPATYVLAVILHEWKVLKLRNRYKVKLQVLHLTSYTVYGAIERVDLVVLNRLHVTHRAYTLGGTGTREPLLALSEPLA
uniref:Uncharacterized protein n=1 Tax=Solanum tuberosum TaxID=4113 RepID=M1DVV6_SOLTU